MIAPQDISTTYGQMGVQNEVIAINGDYYYITKVINLKIKISHHLVGCIKVQK